MWGREKGENGEERAVFIRTLRGLHLLGCIPRDLLRDHNLNNQVQRTQESAAHSPRVFVDCTFLGAFHVIFITAFEQLTLQPSAAHSRKCSALAPRLRGLHLLGCIPRGLYHRIRTSAAHSRKCAALDLTRSTGSGLASILLPVLFPGRNQ
jgi:hypothetical protein